MPGWIYGLAFLSGASGLIYEVVWLRILTRVLGNTVYATSTVLAAFMAGLALGSLVSSRFIDRTRRPLRCYALLELSICFSAVLSLCLPERILPAYLAFHELAGGSRAWLTAGQIGIALALLLLPTALMGAIPALCAFGARCRGGFGRCIGALYALNTFGAVAGVLLSGFVLLGEVGGDQYGSARCRAQWRRGTGGAGRRTGSGPRDYRCPGRRASESLRQPGS